jgi:hypothetical protein
VILAASNAMDILRLDCGLACGIVMAFIGLTLKYSNPIRTAGRKCFAPTIGIRQAYQNIRNAVADTGGTRNRLL